MRILRILSGVIGCPAVRGRLLAPLLAVASVGVACNSAPAPAPPPKEPPTAVAQVAIPPVAEAPSGGPASAAPVATEEPAVGREIICERPELALALVIDRSGSMTGLPLEMAKAGAARVAGSLGKNDLLEVIAFDSAPVRVVKMRNRHDASSLAKLATLQAGGGTEFFEALDAAYQDMTVVSALRKHVVFVTDGQAPTDGMVDLVEAMVAEGITLTAVGLGGSTDRSLLQMIAEKGGGRLYMVQDPNNLPGVFQREIDAVRKEIPRESD